MKQKRKFNLSGVVAFVIAALILVILVPINIIANFYDKNIDMTEKSKYTFTDTTVQLLNETSDKKIEVYFLLDLDIMKNDPEFLPYLPLYHNLMQLEAYENITLTCFMPDERPDLIKMLNPAETLNPGYGDVFIKCGDTIKMIDDTRIFPYDSNGAASYAGEELISGAIKIVTGGSLPTVYFLSGHGEKTIDDSYSTFADILKSDNYDAQTLDLAKEDAVPENAAFVILTGPQKDITEDEKEKLLEYADNGGGMAFFIGPSETSGRFENIEDVLEKFELGLDYNIVKETAPERMMNNRDYEQDPYVFNVTFTPTSDSFTEDLTTEILTYAEESGLISGISNTRSLYQIQDTNSGYIEKSSIITNTMDASGAYTTTNEPMGGDAETAAECAELNEIQLEFGFYSYNKQNGSKMIAIGTTDLFDQDALSASVSVTQQLALNSFIWLYNPDINMNIGNKDTAYDSMHFETPEQAESTLNIFWIVPFCVAAVGLFVWLKRRHS